MSILKLVCKHGTIVGWVLYLLGFAILMFTSAPWPSWVAWVCGFFSGMFRTADRADKVIKGWQARYEEVAGKNG